jgi:uncharacterized protein (TIGR03643 family)
VRARNSLVDLNVADVSRVIEMAWEDRTPFEAIEHQFNLDESAVICLMRAKLKKGSFKTWRKRMSARTTKHAAKHSQRCSAGESHDTISHPYGATVLM